MPKEVVVLSSLKRGDLIRFYYEGTNRRARVVAPVQGSGAFLGPYDYKHETIRLLMRKVWFGDDDIRILEVNGRALHEVQSSHPSSGE